MDILLHFGGTWTGDKGQETREKDTDTYIETDTDTTFFLGMAVCTFVSPTRNPPIGRSTVYSVTYTGTISSHAQV